MTLNWRRTYVAGELADALLNETDLPSELDVNSFDGAETGGFCDGAWRLYRDICANDAV